MKKLILLIGIITFNNGAIAQEASWLDRLKQFIGLTEQTAQAPEQSTSALPSSNGLVTLLTNSLNVNAEQAAGGMGAIIHYVKTNVSSEQYQQLASAVPGVDALIEQMPDISELQSSEGLAGLLDTAAQYSDSLKSVNDLKKQFSALGLEPEMIASFINTAKSYLDSEQGQQAKQILADGVGNILG
ncbi:Protein of unknown function VcgC/VcgE [Colwellia chukchiensis]|uniref:DUF2780 domain-containing protein n=1 Tax=Colwellia chukchiensis TaxID=641665 RepID=A0A1H7QAQ4_9GAMM|nr:DUF2780 domain-containing protein [Colwellia chukchiensis]SEL45241.1 Protein of unknown function VcgC/VcgE [Colwellia chukchiensis]